MKKIMLTLLVLIVALGGAGYWYWNKPHEDVANAEPEMSVNAQDIVTAFVTNEQEANTKYVGKLIEVKGKIFQIDETEDGSVNILLETSEPMNTVLCQLDPLQKQNKEGLVVGKTINIKGICSGFTADVVLDRCHIIK